MPQELDYPKAVHDLLGFPEHHFGGGRIQRMHHLVGALKGGCIRSSAWIRDPLLRVAFVASGPRGGWSCKRSVHSWRGLSNGVSRCSS